MRNPLRLQTSLVHITVGLSTFSFATSLVGVFIPLVILRGGGRLWEVPAFYLIYACSKLLMNYPAVLLLQRRGVQLGLSIAFVAGALQMLSILGFATLHNILPLIAGAVALALTNAYLWNAQHLYISSTMQENTKSSNIAAIAIIGQVSSVVAPLLGGLIGSIFGPIPLLALAVVLCASAIIPLRHIQSVEKQGLPIRYNFQGAPRRDILANFFFNIEASVGVMVWPIYLAVFIATYKSIGAITAIAAGVTVLITWMAGRRGDKGRDRAVLREGVAASSVIDVVRILVTSGLGITIISSAWKASFAYLQNAWTSTYYHHAKQRGLQYIMSMEIACDLAYVTLWGILLVVLLATDSTRTFFVAAFFIAAVSAWGCLLITKQKAIESSPTQAQDLTR
ncbi:MAG TPA: hypothetical protein VGS08_04895 [Candidatus Saccharimonadales bacterium]|nr:hypothetical protein [Candidatus Saccharimonadales bacterium]